MIMGVHMGACPRFKGGMQVKLDRQPRDEMQPGLNRTRAYCEPTDVRTGVLAPGYDRYVGRIL